MFINIKGRIYKNIPVPRGEAADTAVQLEAADRWSAARSAAIKHKTVTVLHDQNAAPR